MLALQHVPPVRPSSHLKNRSANTASIITYVHPAQISTALATVYRLCSLLQPLTLDSQFLQEHFAPDYATKDVSSRKAQSG